jgi:hypothetical protein
MHIDVKFHKHSYSDHQWPRLKNIQTKMCTQLAGYNMGLRGRDPTRIISQPRYN